MLDTYHRRHVDSNHAETLLKAWQRQNDIVRGVVEVSGDDLGREVVLLEVHDNHLSELINFLLIFHNF